MRTSGRCQKGHIYLIIFHPIGQIWRPSVDLARNTLKEAEIRLDLATLKQSVANGRNFAIIYTIVTQSCRAPLRHGGGSGCDSAMRREPAVLDQPVRIGMRWAYLVDTARPREAAYVWLSATTGRAFLSRY